MNRVVSFEIHADNLERASIFYSTVFGWQFSPWPNNPDYLSIKTGEGVGIDGGMVKRHTEVKDDGIIAYVCTIEVADIDKILLAVTDNGGIIAIGRQEVMGVGYLAYCRDSEGNNFGLIQRYPSAAVQA
jgi:uncharacterized protein